MTLSCVTRGSRNRSLMCFAVLLCLALLGTPAPQSALAQTNKWGKLFVQTDPPGASIRFLRIKYRYQPGIILEEGHYTIEVSHPGFEPLLKDIFVQGGVENVIPVSLHADGQPQAAPQAMSQPEAGQPTPEDLRIPVGQPAATQTPPQETYSPGPETAQPSEVPAPQPLAVEPAPQPLPDPYAGQLPPQDAQAMQPQDGQALPGSADPAAQAALPGDPALQSEEPPTYEELMEIGNHLIQAGDVPSAVHAFTVALQQRPNDVLAFVGRGFANYKLGNFAMAVDDLGQALQLDPANLSAWYHRGNAWLMAGDFDKAQQDYSQALLLNKTVPDLFNARGTALYKLGDYQAAIADFDAAIDLDAQYVDAYFNRGNAFLKLEKRQLALDDFNTVLRLNPDDALAQSKAKEAQAKLMQ